MPAGRPTKYDPSLGEKARKLALLGMTDVEVADIFGVNPDTLYEWDNRYPEFSEIRSRGKTEADARVAASLYERAIGYSHEDVHPSSYQGLVTLTPIIKYYPPDTQAATLWLSNRQGGKWKIKSSNQTLDKDGNPTDPVVPVVKVTFGDG